MTIDETRFAWVYPALVVAGLLLLLLVPTAQAIPAPASGITAEPRPADGASSMGRRATMRAAIPVKIPIVAQRSGRLRATMIWQRARTSKNGITAK